MTIPTAMPRVLRSSPSLLARSGLAVGLLAAEYVALFLLLAELFDGEHIAALPDAWRALVWGATYALGGVILGVCAAVLFWGEKVARELARLEAPERPSPAWLAAHALSFLLLGGLTAAVLTRPAVAEQGGLALLALWLAAGAGTVLALARAVFGPRLGDLIRALRGVLLAAGLVGALTAVLMSWLVASWQLLAAPTLALATLLLLPFFDQVQVAPAHYLLGLNGFVVHVGSTCSGIEGIGLITLFLGGYLHQFRDEYRFPRALLLLPAAMLVSFVSNGVRIALLVAIGAYVSPEIASGAFHSMAGWIFFCLLTIGFIALSRRIRWFRRAEDRARDRAAAAGTDNPTARYLLPFLIWLGLGMVASAMVLELDAFYPLRVVVVGALLLALHRGAAESAPAAPTAAAVSGPTGALAPWAIGFGVFAFWLALSPASEPARGLGEVAAATGWSAGFFAFWLVCRLIGTVVIVPIIEERAFRGYLQRRFVGPDFTAVPLGAWHWVPVLASATIFGLMHGNWFAGILAGVAFSYAAFLRGRLTDAIIAHGVANLLLSVWVLGFGRWDLW